MIYDGLPNHDIRNKKLPRVAYTLSKNRLLYALRISDSFLANMDIGLYILFLLVED